MTVLQIAIFGGCLVGLGLTLLLGRLLPARVDSKWALDRLDPVRSLAASSTTIQPATGLQDRLGLMVQRRGPAALLERAPRSDLAVLRRTPQVYYGEKALMFLIGLAFPPVATIVFSLLGLHLPVALPVFASLLLAVLFWLVPDMNIRAEAKEARTDFVRHLATYVDLVAMERAGGSGTNQALTAAAAKADTWVFIRLLEVLREAELAGQAPWDALKDLGDELEIPELIDVGEIMRLSREEDAAAYGPLRARASSIRNALLNDDLARANNATERISFPIVFMLLAFIAILGTPAFLRLIG